MSGLGIEDAWVMKQWTMGERFGANVVWLRIEAGLQQQELAARIGMRRQVLSKIERGEQVPRLDTILVLAAGLEVSTCQLVAWLWWDPPRHESYETPPAIAEMSGYEVLDFDLPGGFRISPVGYESRERFKDRLRQMGEDPHERDILDALSDDAPEGPRHQPPDQSWLVRAGAALKALREERGLTRDQLASKAPTTAAFIAQLEEAECSNPALRMFREICKALDGDGSDLAVLIEKVAAPRRAAREEWMREVRRIAGRGET
ncbi:MAG: transcriptional regulator [Actinobacteria bacterium]|nr:MAG: transcriptional regulator [Actinomycetota bacterium]